MGWLSNLFLVSNKSEEDKALIEEEIPKKSEECKLLTLQERLEIYKILTKKIRWGEKETGYKFNTSDKRNITFEYKKLSGHLIIERSLNNFYYGICNVVNIFEEGQEKEAKEYCYQQMIKNIRKNTRFLFGEFWDSSLYPYKHESGSISIVSCLPIIIAREETPEQKRRNKWHSLGDYNKWRSNKLRIRHGLEKII